MKKQFLTSALLMLAILPGFAQKKDIVKTGWNLGPLPAIAFDADKGFQYGAILQFFDYGNGTNYPNYDQKIYLEASFFTKGSQLYQLRYDNKSIIPGVRLSSSLKANFDKAYDFYGFNGYQSFYNFDRVAEGKAGDKFLFSPFYRHKRNEVLFRTDIIGEFMKNLSWEAGVFGYYHDLGTIDYKNINKGKDESEMYPEILPTLFDVYKTTGVISKEEADGGFSGGVRLGMVYDSRNKEGAPSDGIWAEGHLTAALPGISKIPYYRYSFTWRQYLPIITNDVLTFAYRLNYEGTLGDNAPFYALPYMTVMGERSDLEGMGGYNTTRGIMRTRVVGLDMATYNAEFRWRFLKTSLANQNIALALSAFSDGTMATRGRDLSALYSPLSGILPQELQVVSKDNKKDTPHVTVGGGFRFIMNENFIVALEYGTPVSHFMKNSPTYNQDGTGAFYINIGYLF